MKFPLFFLSPRRKQNCQQMQLCHLDLCHRVHMSYQTVSDLPGRHNSQTVSETPPSFSPSLVKQEPNYADAARDMLDRPYPVCVTWMCTLCMAQYKGRSMPRTRESVYTKYLYKAFLLSLFPTSKMDYHMCLYAVSLNASETVTQNNFKIHSFSRMYGTEALSKCVWLCS